MMFQNDLGQSLNAYDIADSLSIKLKEKNVNISISSGEDFLSTVAYAYGFENWNKLLLSFNKVNGADVSTGQERIEFNRDFNLNTEISDVDFLSLLENEINGNFTASRKIVNFAKLSLGYHKIHDLKGSFIDVISGSSILVSDYPFEHINKIKSLLEQNKINYFIFSPYSGVKIDILNSLIYSNSFDPILTKFVKSNHYFAQLWHLIVRYISQEFKTKFTAKLIKYSFTLDFTIKMFFHFQKKSHFLSNIVKSYLLKIIPDEENFKNITHQQKELHYLNCGELISLFDNVIIDYEKGIFSDEGILINSDICSEQSDIFYSESSKFSATILLELMNKVKNTEYIINTSPLLALSLENTISVIEYVDFINYKVNFMKNNLIFCKSKPGAILPNSLKEFAVNNLDSIDENIFNIKNRYLSDLNYEEYYSIKEKSKNTFDLIKFSFF